MTQRTQVRELPGGISSTDKICRVLVFLVALNCNCLFAEDRFAVVRIGNGQAMIRDGNSLFFPQLKDSKNKFPTRRLDLAFEIQRIDVLEGMSMALISGVRSSAMLVDSSGRARQFALFGVNNAIACSTVHNGQAYIVFAPIDPLTKALGRPGAEETQTAVTRVMRSSAESMAGFLRQELPNLKYEIEEIPQLDEYRVHQIVFIGNDRYFELSKNYIKVDGEIRRPVKEMLLATLEGGELQIAMDSGAVYE